MRFLLNIIYMGINLDVIRQLSSPEIVGKSFCPIVQSSHHAGEFLETSLFLVVFHIPVCLQSSYFATRHVSVNFD